MMIDGFDDKALREREAERDDKKPRGADEGL